MNPESSCLNNRIVLAFMLDNPESGNNPLPATDFHCIKIEKPLYLASRCGTVAQSVEQRTENPCVGGSIPPGPTID
jgi:hypothetical protein